MPYLNSLTPRIRSLNFQNCAREEFFKFIFPHLMNIPSIMRGIIMVTQSNCSWKSQGCTNLMLFLDESNRTHSNNRRRVRSRNKTKTLMSLLVFVWFLQHHTDQGLSLRMYRPRDIWVYHLSSRLGILHSFSTLMFQEI